VKFLKLIIVASAFFLPLVIRAQIVSRQFLHGHVPPAVLRLTPVGRVAASARLNLAIGLPLRNEDVLNNFLKELSDPASPNFRKYLTPEQFAEQFGPTEQDYEAVAAFMAGNGLAVTGRYPNRAVLDVSGTAADIEKVFHVTMRTYRHPREVRNFFAPDAELSVDLNVPILHVSGLDNYSLPHPKFQIRPAGQISGAVPNAGSGPNGNYQGNDFRAAYLPGVTTNQLSGAGQVIGLLQFEGYFSNDITLYENQAGLPPVSLTNILIDGFSGVPVSPTNDTVLEVSLDIEMAISMAPGVSKIIVYEEPNGNPWPDILARMANDNIAKQISCSWGNNSPSAPDPTSEGIFKQMVAQGQSFFDASGDSDAFTSGIPFPAESTNITQVGGTTLTTSGPSGSWVSEKVWNWDPVGVPGVGSGGGVSANYSIPIWQQGINMTTNKGSTTFRNVPDVAMTADEIFVKFGNGLSATNVDGTSCAAPLWAGFTALINQEAAAAGKPPVGFINPAVYAIGKGANYTSDFHDITTGNNFWSSSPNRFAAKGGYDLCTGWGTPKGLALINVLAIPDALSIVPGTGFASVGVTGGPFSPSSQIFSLTNSGNTSLNWSFVSVSNLFNASPASGTLAIGGAANVSVNLSSAASNLVAGNYFPTATFSNQTSGVGQDRQFNLQIGQTVVQNGGFETGDLTSWTLAGNGVINNSLFDGVVNTGNLGSVATNYIHSGNDGMALGDTNVAYISQNVPTLPGANYLISFWLDNYTGATPNQFLVNWNTNTVTTNTIFNSSNIGVQNWTNMLFVVTATGTNTTLQFGAENDNDFFGLDDIAVNAIPLPSFRTFSKTNSTLNFTWNALAGVLYQMQFSTNLSKTNWINLGAPVTATNSIIILTNSIGPDAQRFYRVRRLP
jgi:hypothetical protein